MGNTALMKMNTLQPGASGWRAAGLNIALNLVLPVLILMRGGAVLGWPALLVLLLAVAFPLGWGMFELVWRGRYNMYSLVGLAGVVMTGGIGILQLPARWLAVKEAGVPFMIGLGVVLSGILRRPVVGSLLESVVDWERVHASLQARGAMASYQRLLSVATYAVAASFFLSAVLNWVLARSLVESAPGTDAFNEEYGRLTLLSYPIIAGPTLLVLWLACAWLIVRLKRLSGLPLRQLVRGYAE